MTPPRERVEALLADEATVGLDAASSIELEYLLAAHADVDRYALERTVAAVFLAVGAAKTEPMPASLRAKLMADND